MFIKVVFKSILGKLCPEEYSVEAKTPSEAIRAVTNQLKDKLIKPNGLRWVCRVKGYETVDSLKSVCEEGTVLEVYPDFRASGLFSWVKIVVGAIFIVAGIFFGQPWAVSLGASLVLSGIADLLTPGASNGKEEEASRYFGHRQNTTLIGTRIPIAYGRNKIYGHLLSLNTGTGSNQVEKYVLNVNTSGGKITGVTPTNPNYPYTPDISTDGESATIEVPKDSEVIVEITKPDGTTEDTTIIVDDNKTENLDPELPILSGEVGSAESYYSKGNVFTFSDDDSGVTFTSLRIDFSDEDIKDTYSKPNVHTYFSPKEFAATDTGQIYTKDNFIVQEWTSDSIVAITSITEGNGHINMYAVGYIFVAAPKDKLLTVPEELTGLDKSARDLLVSKGTHYIGNASKLFINQVFPKEDYYIDYLYKVLYKYTPGASTAALSIIEEVPYGRKFSTDISGQSRWVCFNFSIGDGNPRENPRSIWVAYEDIKQYTNITNNDPRIYSYYGGTSARRTSFNTSFKYKTSESGEIITSPDMTIFVVMSDPDFGFDWRWNSLNNSSSQAILTGGTVALYFIGKDLLGTDPCPYYVAMVPAESQSSI